MSYLSYAKKMRLGICVDSGVVPERQEGAKLLLEWMIQDLKHLAQSVNLAHDDATMFTNLNTNNSRAGSVVEDFGYGGELPSDISCSSQCSTQDDDDGSSRGEDTDEDVGEIVKNKMKIGQEFVGFKKVTKQISENNNNNDKDKDHDDGGCMKMKVYFSLDDSNNVVDQRFLMSHHSHRTELEKSKGKRLCKSMSSSKC